MLLSLSAIYLSGCATRHSNSIICPPLKTYSDEVQEKLVKELSLIDEEAVVMLMIQDYAQLRDMVRGCKEAQ